MLQKEYSKRKLLLEQKYEQRKKFLKEEAEFFIDEKKDQMENYMEYNY